MDKKNVAIVGYGGQGAWHADHALNSDVVSLAGIFDIKEARNELAASKGIRVYRSFKELISDETVDIVVVATPNDVHEKYAVAAMKAGKHVICEKPVTLSLRSFDRMIDAANKSGVKFSVHQNRRWDVDYLAMKQVIESGMIGDVINVESRIHGSRGIPSDWRGMAKYGGGMLYDWGVHIIDQTLMLIGFDVKTVYCTFDHITNDEVDDGFRLNIETKAGKKAYLEVGTYNFIPMPRFYMRGTKGTAKIEDWQKKCEVAIMKAWNEKEVLPVQTAAGITKTMAPRDELTLDYKTIDRPVSDVHDFYRNFVGAINGECEQLILHEQSRKVLEVIFAAFDSAKKQRPVELK